MLLLCYLQIYQIGNTKKKTDNAKEQDNFISLVVYFQFDKFGNKTIISLVPMGPMAAWAI